MAAAAIPLGAAVIGAGAGIYSANKAASAQTDLYNKNYEAQRQAAWANADAQMSAAEAQAEGIVEGARAQAHGMMGAAEAQASALSEGAKVQSEAATVAAQTAYAEVQRNVGLMKTESEESLRKLEADQVVYEERARAKAAASGGEYVGSTKAYVEGMISENDRQYGWLKNAYAKQRSVAMQNATAERAAQYQYANTLIKAGGIEAKATREAAYQTASGIMAGARFESAAAKAIAASQMSAVRNTYGARTYAPAASTKNSSFNAIAAKQQQQQRMLYGNN